MNLVPLVGTQIHLRKIPQELLHKVLRSPRSELVPRGAVCGTRSCPWGGSWGSRVGPGREVLKRGTPIPLKAKPSVQHLLLPKLPAILASPPQVGAKTWSAGGGGLDLLHTPSLG